MFLLSLTSAFAQTNKTWTGPAGGDWFNPNNWTPVGVPSTNDTINFTNGTINVTAPVSIFGQFNWSGGTLGGNALTIASNGVLNINGAVILTSALTNSGTVNWTSGNLNLLACSDTRPIVNLAGGLWNIQGFDQILSAACGPGQRGYFQNLGTVRKSAGTGATAWTIPLLNSGTVTVLQGTLRLQSGGPMDGDWNAASGAAIQFGLGSFSYSNAPVLTGPGVFQLTGGSLTLLDDVFPNLALVGGTLTLGTNFQGGTITNLTLGAVTLAGSNQIVSGTFNWAGATVQGSLLVGAGATANWSGGIAAGPVMIASSGVLNLNGGASVFVRSALTNGGTVTWVGGGLTLDTCGAGPIVNLAGGVWDNQTDRLLGFNCALNTNAFFQNNGTVRKSAGTGATPWSIPLTNFGSVNVSQGTLALNAGFTPAGGTLEFGVNSLSSFGKITIAGNATLGGTLRAVWLGGYVPALSNSFAVLTYGSRTGVFTNLDLPPAALWQTNYGATAFTLTVININKLAFAPGPSGTNAGAILAPVVVQVQDANGNPVATNGVAVTLALASGSGPLNGTLTRATDPTGKATFNDLSLNLVGSRTLRASASQAGLTPVISSSFTISPAAAAQLILMTPISSLQADGVAFSPPPRVQARDQFGNIVIASVPITARLSSSTGGNLGGTTNANTANGLASFSNLRYNLLNPRAPETFVAYFDSPGLIPATNSPVLAALILTNIVLQDGNSVIRIDPVTQRGLFSWTVDGVQQAHQHWFWFRAGTNAAQTSFDRLGTPWGLAYTTSNAVLNYFAQGLSVQAGFTLQGGAPGSQASDLAETLTLQNITNTPITLHLFAYSDFDLGNSPYADTVSRPSPQAFLQQGKGMQVTETVQTTTPDHWEASFYAITLAGLLDSSPLTLSDSFIPPAPGDQTYAFQWDVNLAVGGTLVLNLTKSIRPMTGQSVRNPVPIELRIALSDADIILSWPTNGAAGFELQSGSMLSSEGGWTTVTNLPAVVGEQFQVTLPHSFGAQFYRLQK